MPAFMRQIKDQRIIAALKQEKLFNDKILPDVKAHNIFPAIRNDAVSFYYCGSRLFEYTDTFRTHRKYIPISANRNYFSEEDLVKGLEEGKINFSFFKDYEEIKLTSKMYATVEASGLSPLYSNYSCFNISSDIIVLDIEISFESDNEDASQDRIDLLLFNKRTQALMFVEGKHYSNPEIWSQKESKPSVIKQIERYNKQINTRRQEIIKNYAHYVHNINELFELNLPVPVDCCPISGLYIFGFDKNQKEGRLSELLLNDGSLKDQGYYCRGDAADTEISTVWEKIQKTYKNPG